jgi:peptidoglycan hydrolase-like protein with peptidoglycan-binding domain
VQIALMNLGLYEGSIDGVSGEGTKTALRRFQTLKKIEASGLMTTETLNGLGVPAVQ